MASAARAPMHSAEISRSLKIETMVSRPTRACSAALWALLSSAVESSTAPASILQHRSASDAPRINGPSGSAARLVRRPLLERELRRPRLDRSARAPILHFRRQSRVKVRRDASEEPEIFGPEQSFRCRKQPRPSLTPSTKWVRCATPPRHRTVGPSRAHASGLAGLAPDRDAEPAGVYYGAPIGRGPAVIHLRPSPARPGGLSADRETTHHRLRPLPRRLDELPHFRSSTTTGY